MNLSLLTQIMHTPADETGSGVPGSVNYGTRRSGQPAGENKGQSVAEDTVTLSPEGKDKAFRADTVFGAEKTGEESATESLDQQELAQLQQLKRRDVEVRAHEQAHLSAAGQYARGGASFTLQKGPDGVSYAIGGEVGIDVAKEATPAATITKMQTVKRAALAPANPSGADKRIAAQAGAKEAQARQELFQVQQEALLRSEEGAGTLSRSDVAGKGAEPDTPAITASTYGSLKTKFAVYEKMAAK